MKQLVLKKFSGQFNNLAKKTIEAGKRIGSKTSDKYTVLFLTSDLVKAGIIPSSNSSKWSPMLEPTEDNVTALIAKVTKPDQVILNEILNTKYETLEVIAVPSEFIKWPNGRNFWYDVDVNGRAKVNLSEVTEDQYKTWNSDEVAA